MWRRGDEIVEVVAAICRVSSTYSKPAQKASFDRALGKIGLQAVGEVAGLPE